MTTSEAIWYASAGLAACGALWLWYLALFRDTSRRAARRAGREGQVPRCPRCAYDLSGAMGQDNTPPTCPECGRRAKRARALFRTRRKPLIAALAAIAMLLATAAALMPTLLGPRPCRFVPTSVLVWLFEPVPLSHASTPGRMSVAISNELLRRHLTPRQKFTIMRRTIPFEDGFPSVWLADTPVPILPVIMPPFRTDRVWDRFTVSPMHEVLAPFAAINPFRKYVTESFRFEPVLLPGVSMGTSHLMLALRWYDDTPDTFAQMMAPPPDLNISHPIRIVDSVDDVLSPLDNEEIEHKILNALRIQFDSVGMQVMFYLPDNEIISAAAVLTHSDGRWFFMKPHPIAPMAILQSPLGRRDASLPETYLFGSSMKDWTLTLIASPVDALRSANVRKFATRSYWNGSLSVTLDQVPLLDENDRPLDPSSLSEYAVFPMYRPGDQPPERLAPFLDRVPR